MLVRRLVAALALAPAVLIALPNAAHAAGPTAAHVVLTSDGYYTDMPGTLPGPFVHWTAYYSSVSVTGVVDGAAYALAWSGCSMNGYGYTETIAGGVGSVWWTCQSGPFAGMGGAGTFVRAGLDLEIVWNGDLNGALRCAMSPEMLWGRVLLNCQGAMTGPTTR